MKALIIEDETAAATNLKSLLREIDPSVEIVDVIDTVVDSIGWIRANPLPDIVFMDIHLADGQAFKIFEQVDIPCPIVFTTAYDRYALDAFKVNSIDYILKPIKKQELERAFEKFKRLSGREKAEYVEQTQRYLSARAQSFLIPFRDKLVPLTPDEIAYCYTADEKVSVVTFDGRSLPMDKPLDTLIALLPERDFYPGEPAIHRLAPRRPRPVGMVRQPAVGQPDRQNPGTHRRQQGAGSGFQKMVYR